MKKQEGINLKSSVFDLMPGA